ncbi:hypothetical protein K9N68_23335 [Kovacikia minuta CCNUW1]|uniref:hypothetical protein n=1 Tax=Kovacikia minuta TaxID=2931930 RepID=UPI001CCE5698|nr:hypothetical protein [Kovacikia minuta]UBF24592.1 hypothetical protein K9N68_23335 [Kovacikia minuta CCNUW1]
MAYWIKLTYERNTYVIDLDRVAAFCYVQNGRISFSLVDSNTAVIVNQQNDPATYQSILDYIEKRTGHTLP